MYKYYIYRDIENKVDMYKYYIYTDVKNKVDMYKYYIYRMYMLRAFK